MHTHSHRKLSEKIRYNFVGTEQYYCITSTSTVLLTLIRVALEENLQLLVKTILHHDALG